MTALEEDILIFLLDQCSRDSMPNCIKEEMHGVSTLSVTGIDLDLIDAWIPDRESPMIMAPFLSKIKEHISLDIFDKRKEFQLARFCSQSRAFQLILEIFRLE